MKILVVTEKYSPIDTQKDGGAQLIKTLMRSFGEKLDILQFNGEQQQRSEGWSFRYPHYLEDRFERRVANAPFVAERVREVAKEKRFTHIIFIHISMQFESDIRNDIETWTFPMFLTPSYRASGEVVPLQYTEMEKKALSLAKNIITPSYFEKRQLLEYYGVAETKIHVIPRGVDTRALKPVSRKMDDKNSVVFCSIGSIKPQKNTLGLIDIFSKVAHRYEKAILRLIGPIQNLAYYEKVRQKIEQLGLGEKIHISEYIPHNKISGAVADAHIHISASNCETFGRSIFETLALGLPNVAFSKNNAAHDFLGDAPYIKFVQDQHEALKAIDELLANFSLLSSLAVEMGHIYNDKMLGNLIVAKIACAQTLLISDYDGTLFHKADPLKTDTYIKQFKQFFPKVICTARSIKDILKEMKSHGITVDWIIAHSGAVIANGQGDILKILPLHDVETQKIMSLASIDKKITIAGKLIQTVSSSSINRNHCPELRIEVYEGKSFILSWRASKLRAICWLLTHINWEGRVKTLGDGKYDLEFLRYFDGQLIRSESEVGSFDS